MSQRDIAKKLQVGKSSIGRYIKDVWQIAPPEKTSKINQKLVRNKEEIIRLYVEEKMTTREIAKIYEVSDTTIATYLKNFKVKLRPPQNQMQPLDKKIYGYFFAVNFQNTTLPSNAILQQDIKIIHYFILMK